MMPSPICNQLGDFTVVRFAEETQVVLFSLHAGEVLMCGAKEWEGLRQEQSSSVSELKATLLGLGLQVL